MNYSIVIVTYYKRFETWLKPLITDIKRQRSEVEIIICVNGELDYFDEEYRKNLLDFIKDYPNVFLVMYPRFRSIAKLWNLGVQASTNETVLMLNDDVTLEDGFFDEYEKVKMPVFSVNITTSVLTFTKSEMIRLNWFDERYLGIGWEDDDLMKRYMKAYDLAQFPNVNIEWCKNVVNINFYKVHNERLAEQIRTEKIDDRIKGQKRDKKHGRYSEFNRTINLDNPKLQYPYESFYMENKHKL